MTNDDPEAPGPSPPSDAGPIVSRRGYKYQDHLAVHFILRMMAESSLSAVECETSDDIVLLWNTGASGKPEYVQVKTTDDDSKWSQTEITQRPIADKPTSLIEKSLLCDCKGADAQFRIVTLRGVNKGLACLTQEVHRRAALQDVEKLATKFAKKYPTKSGNGHDLGYWTKNTVWQVVGSMESLIAKNHQAISRLAEQHGANPTHSHIATIYDHYLRWADDAATASWVADPRLKTITRQQALQKWAEHMANTAAAQKRTSKPYRVKTDPFFAELHHLTEDDIRRALSGYDARYERKRWRSQELADYLADWLPEIALKASELVEVQHLNMRHKRANAIKEIKRHRDVDPARLLGEVLLHSILRHHFQSEPIACKLFYASPEGTKTFGNAHIVHRPDGDELWLGHSVVCDITTYDAVLAAITAELDHALDPDFLKAEREVILTLREPNHLLPTTLESAFERHAPTDDILRVLSICLLVGYDSSVLMAGFSDDYRQRLVEEVTARYGGIKSSLPASIEAVRVHVFLIPLECMKTLIGNFSRALEQT